MWSLSSTTSTCHRYYVHKLYDGCVEPYHLSILMMNEGGIFMIEDNYFFSMVFPIQHRDHESPKSEIERKSFFDLSRFYY